MKKRCISKLLTIFCFSAMALAMSSVPAQADVFVVTDYVPDNEFGGSPLNRKWQPTFNISHDLPVGDISSLSVRLQEDYAIRMTNFDDGGVAEAVSINIRHVGTIGRDGSQSYKIKLFFSDETDFEIADGVEGSGISVREFADIVPNGTFKDLIRFDIRFETLDNPVWEIGTAAFEFQANDVRRVSLETIPEPSPIAAMLSSMLCFVTLRWRR